MQSENMTKVGNKNDFVEGQAQHFKVAGKNILVCLFKDQFFAMENDCPHQGEPLHAGRVKDYCISCPAHNWSFDLRNGESPVIPDVFVYTFDVKLEENGDVLVSHKKNY